LLQEKNAIVNDNRAKINVKVEMVDSSYNNLENDIIDSSVDNLKTEMKNLSLDNKPQIVENLDLKRQDSVAETREPLTSQYEDRTPSLSSQDDEIWFNKIVPSDINYLDNLCHENSYKYLEYKAETQSEMMFSLEPNNSNDAIHNELDEYTSFNEQVSDSEWILSSSGDLNHKESLNSIQSDLLFQLDDAEDDYCHFI